MYFAWLIYVSAKFNKFFIELVLIDVIASEKLIVDGNIKSIVKSKIIKVLSRVAVSYFEEILTRFMLDKIRDTNNTTNSTIINKIVIVKGIKREVAV